MPFDPNDPNFAVEMAGAPFHWQGDTGVLNWLGEFYDSAYQEGVGSVPPVITALNPDTAPANADVTVTIDGDGFDRYPTVNIGVAHSLVPTSVSTTQLVVVVEAINIEQPGTLAVSVKNADGQVSNALDFTAT